MAQYDLHLTQNTSAGSIEFTEKIINIAKGGLLSANASGVPTVLAGGTNGYMLVRNDATATGLDWQIISAGHTQHTDTGTTNNTFTVDSDGTTGKIILDADNVGGNFTTTIENQTQAGNIVLTLPATTGTLALTSALHTQNTDTGTTNNTFEISSDGSAGSILIDGAQADGDYETRITNQSQSGNIVLTLPAVTGTLATEAFATGLLAANDAMLYKGTIGSGGTHEIAAFNALTTYNAGWTYRVITAGTVRGVVCQIGDMVTVLVDRAGSGNLDSDFTVMQTNIDGAVIGPASVTDGYPALFDGTTGKLLKAGLTALGTAAGANIGDFVQVNTYNANTILAATNDNSPAALTVGEQTIVGRKTGGAIAALTGTEVMNVIWTSAPESKTASGTAGSIAYDGNYFFICDATNTWIRTTMATNW